MMVAFAHCLLSLQVSAQLGGSFPWQSELYTAHELIGRIWDSRRGQFVTDTELWDTLLESSYVLLGEKHDNPDHHALQLRVLQALINADKCGQAHHGNAGQHSQRESGCFSRNPV